LGVAEGVKIQLGQGLDQINLWKMTDDRWSLADPVAGANMNQLLNTRTARRL
jgi:hypothetical protein